MFIPQKSLQQDQNSKIASLVYNTSALGMCINLQYNMLYCKFSSSLLGSKRYCCD